MPEAHASRFVDIPLEKFFLVASFSVALPQYLTCVRRESLATHD